MKLLFIFPELVSYLGNLQRKGQKKTTNGVSQSNHSPVPKSRETIDSWDVVAVNISPEMGERIMISGSRETLEELFPEIAHTLQDARHSLAWNSSSKYVIRYARENKEFLRTASCIREGANVSIKFDIYPHHLKILALNLNGC